MLHYEANRTFDFQPTCVVPRDKLLTVKVIQLIQKRFFEKRISGAFNVGSVHYEYLFT